MTGSKATGASSRSDATCLEATAGGEEIVDRVASVLHPYQEGRKTERAGITLSYAQSIDGSIAANIGARTAISGDQSNIVTHRLRAMHAAILVGVGTVLVDDPQLTVRHVSGQHPRPVIIDSQLRTPVHAQLLQRRDASPLIVATQQASLKREQRLREAGASVLRIGAEDAELVDLKLLFERFRRLGIATVMVEGGASIIASILRAELADQLLVTIAPRFLGGLHAVSGFGDIDPRRRPRLTHTCFTHLQDDLVVYGRLVRSR